jgi:formylglycine-generating enzyme required for sulfatase activity
MTSTIPRLRPTLRLVWPLIAAASLVGCAGGDQPEASGPAAKEMPAPFDITLPNTTASMHMVPIPAGTITIADESAPGGQRTIEVGPFWMSQTEVTWDMFDIYVYRLDEVEPDPAADAITRPSKPYLPPDRGFGHAGYPAISIASDAAAQFCTWLSAKTGKRFRLATEAEWEYAAQGPAIVEQIPVDELAWHAGNSEGKTHPVGEKLPNGFSLHDTLGNVAEWTIGLDGKPVTRGGSFADLPEALSPQIRAPYSRAWQSRDPQIPKSKWWLSDGPFVGFRVVCEPEPAAPAQP